MKLKSAVSLLFVLLVCFVFVERRIAVSTSAELRRKELGSLLDDVWSHATGHGGGDKSDVVRKSLPVESRRTLHALCNHNDSVSVLLEVVKEFKNQVGCCCKNTSDL